MQERDLENLIPIAGAGYAILPEVALLGKDLFETSRHAQKYGLEVLPLIAVNRTARAVKPEKPTKEFREYARTVGKGLTPDIIDKAYRKLHNQIWEEYFIRAKEVLVWRPTTHPRIVAGKETAQPTSTLLRDYRVPVDKDVFDISGIEKPTIEVQWPTKNGTIPRDLAKLFDADLTTFVYTSPDIDFEEGVRALVADFWLREWPVLGSFRGPLYGYSDGGSLLGRKIKMK